MATCNEPQDQIRNYTVQVVNGHIVTVNAAQMKAQSPAGSVFVFTKNYTFHYVKHTVAFRQGRPYVLESALVTALQAASAPMVAA